MKIGTTVRVRDFRMGSKKLKLDMEVVNFSTGRDGNPGHVQLENQMLRFRGWFKANDPRIAVLSNE